MLKNEINNREYDSKRILRYLINYFEKTYHIFSEKLKKSKSLYLRKKSIKNLRIKKLICFI